jgi:GNAT superfamily N-acetyltransferase
MRELAPDDEASLARFFEENNVPEVTDLFKAFAFDAATAKKLCREPRRDRYFAMFDGERMLCLGIMRGWDEGYEIPTLGIVAHHEMHGKGHGFRLLLWGIELGKQLGCKKMRATTFKTHTVVIKMLEKTGFRITGELPGDRLEFFGDF